MRIQLSSKKQAISILFLMFLSILPLGVMTVDYSTTQVSESTPDFYQNQILSSEIPEFDESLQSSQIIISPENQDGIKDQAELSFTPSIDSSFNFTIEKKADLINYHNAYGSIAGNETKLYMVYTKVRDYDGDENSWIGIYYRTSEDLGETWSDEEYTGIYTSASWTSACFYNLKLVHNETDGSLFLLITRYYRLYPFEGNYQLSIYKSSNGCASWQNQGSGDPVLSDLNSDERRDLVYDFEISNNNTELYISVAREYDERVYFLKSQDEGVTWEKKLVHVNYIEHSYCGSSLAVAPDDTLTTFWWDSTEKYYYMSNSTDFGATWSTPVKLNEDRGLMSISAPWNPGRTTDNYDSAYEVGAFETEYTETGFLKTYFIYNDTKIFTAISENGGYSWINVTEYRNFGTISEIYHLDYDYVSPDQEFIYYIGNMIGVTLPGSGFVTNTKIIRSITNGSATGNQETTIIWNGKNNQGEFVEDGIYIAKILLKDQLSNDINQNPKFAYIQVDNSIQNINLEQKNQFFSPDASIGVKDSTSISLEVNDEGLNYFLYVENEYGYTTRPTARVTNHEVAEINPDISFDKNDRMHCVYVSYQSNDRDLYYRTSDDFGLTYSIATPLVTGNFYEDNPVIAIHDNSIYVVFMRFRASEQDYTEYNFDLFIMKSENLGQSWSEPINITAGEYTPNYDTDYYAPDLMVTNNGSIIVSYNAVNGSTNAFYTIYSSDYGKTFSKPRYVAKKSAPTSPIGSNAYASGLAYNYDEDTIYIACVNRSSSNPSNYGIIFLNSTDYGNLWSEPKEIHSIPYVDFPTGLTLDYINSEKIRTTYYYYYESQYYSTGIMESYESSNNGESWSRVQQNSIDPIETSDSPSWRNHYSYLHSGQTQRHDIFYAYGFTPDSTENTDVYVRPYAKTVYQESGLLQPNENHTLTWDGLNFWNQYYEGKYNITLVLTDLAGNKAEAQTNCIIDNSLPEITLDILNTTLMTPLEEQIIAVFNTTKIDANVSLYYRYSLSNEYTVCAMLYNGTHYVYTIPASTEYNTVFFYVNATDDSGNTVLTADQYYFEVEFTLLPENFDFDYSSGNEERKLDDDIEISVTGLNWDMVSGAYLNYSFNDGDWVLVEMSFVDDSKYSYYLPGSPQHYKLEYEIVINDVKNDHHTYSIKGLNAITQDYVPQFPEISLSYPDNMYVMIASILVGLVASALFIFTRNSSSLGIRREFLGNVKQYSKYIKLNENHKQQIGMESENDELPMNSNQTELTNAISGFNINQHPYKLTSKNRGMMLFFLSMSVSVACLVGSILPLFNIVNGTTGLLCASAGLIFAAIALMEKVMSDGKTVIYREEKINYIPMIIISLIMACNLAFFMIDGQFVEWFNYYVVQDVFTIGSIQIPNLWLSLTTPFITVVVIIIITTYRDLKITSGELTRLRQANANWKDVWEKKQEKMAELTSNIGIKMVVFVATIAFTVISTTEMGRYAELGMLLIAPLAIVFVLAIFISSLYARKQKSTFEENLQSMIIEKTKTCPECSTENFFNNIYCTKCQYQFTSGTKVLEDTVECDICKEKSPADSEFCRYCGHNLNQESLDNIERK